jgi:mevalonate kinase
VVTYAKPVYFVKEQPIETFRVGKPFTIVIGDTGISAPTKESVSDVRRLWLSDKPRWESIFDKIAEISLTARRAIEQGHWELLGGLMNENHRLLQEMTVSSAALDKLVSAACKAGALGAKMSGGGRGGNMIALVEEKNTTVIAEALKVSGAMNTIVSLVR